MRRHIRKTKGPTAQCVVCNTRCALRLDGLIRLHRKDHGAWPNATCAGSHMRPVRETIQAP